ncbi:MAG: diguanylate cyclase (GGDEF)-like protein [Glaciecola sp.]|jgi:diguanylate cyclase (GGDEF)-like protein
MGAVLGALAFIVNAFFVVNMVGGVPIYFGSAFVLLCLLALPFHVAFLVLSASTLPLLIYETSIPFGWLHCLQFFVVALLLHYGVRFLTAILLFWLLIGLPTSSFIVVTNLSLNFQSSVFMALPFVISAYVCAMFALIVYWLLPVNTRFNQVRALPKFSAVVFEFNLVSVMLPVFMVVLFFIDRSTHDSEVLVSVELDNAIEQVNTSSTRLLDDKVHALTSTATLLVNEKNTQNHAKILDTVANASPNIESMVISDKDGNILLAAPAEYAEKLPVLSDLNISYRNYFQKTKESNKPVVSKAIEGKGLGSLDIVAITAPIIIDGGFAGLVQAAIKLELLVDQSVIDVIQSGKIAIIVTDAQDSIVYSSALLGLNKLDYFEKDNGAAAYSFSLPQMTISEQDYLYREFSNGAGWKMYALTKPSRVFKDTSTYFTFMIIIFLISIIFIGILSKGLASNIVRPLRNLEAFIKGQKRPENLMVEAKVSREMFNVTKSVIKTQKLTMDFQSELKEQVAEKTKELQVLNATLLRVSRTDALTGLFNRGAFDSLAKDAYMDCRRNKKAFTLTLIDIDLFKNVNDSYGHNAGDQCLINIANIIADMCRRETDIVARYGGEEFVLFFASDEPEKHIQHIELIRAAIAKYQTTYDGFPIQLTVSCGAVRVEDDFSKDLTDLISLADEQLYLGKNKGRNQVNSTII